MLVSGRVLQELERPRGPRGKKLPERSAVLAGDQHPGNVRDLKVSQRVHVGIWYILRAHRGFPYTYFKAQVYPIYLHGPFGFAERV